MVASPDLNAEMLLTGAGAAPQPSAEWSKPTYSDAERGGAALRLRLAVLTCLFVVIFASRVIRLNTLEMDKDEIWSVWQTFGTPAQIVSWTPYDWSPLFYLIVGAWHSLVGIHPFPLRLLVVFGFLIGAAILYRLARTLLPENAEAGALITVAACAAMGYAIHIGLLLRGYSLLFTVTLLAWWMAIRYFRRPSVRRAGVLAVCLAVMIYLHITALFTLLMIGLFTLVLYGRQAWRWWLPGIMTLVLAFPEINSKLLIGAGRASTGLPVLQAWLAGGAHIYVQVLENLVRDFAGYGLMMWAAFIGISAALILGRYGVQRRTLALILWMLAPILFFFVQLWDAFTNRHLAWVMPGVALWIGWGFAQLPRAGIAGLMVVLGVVMFGPVPIAERYKKVDAPLVAAFTFLTDHLQIGDAFLIDPNYKDVPPEEWDYYVRAYLPSGLRLVSDPGRYQRVWYVAADGQQDPPTFAAVQRQRAPGMALTAPGFTLRLYEAPPDINGVAFENGMRFHGVESADNGGPLPLRRPGENLHLRLWWSVDKQVPLDYSIGVYVLGEGGLVAQYDGPPQPSDAPQETSRWVQNRYYVQDLDVALPDTLAAGNYAVKLAVYYWQDARRLSASGVDGDHLLPLLTIPVRR